MSTMFERYAAARKRAAQLKTRGIYAVLCGRSAMHHEESQAYIDELVHRLEAAEDREPDKAKVLGYPIVSATKVEPPPPWVQKVQGLIDAGDISFDVNWEPHSNTHTPYGVVPFDQRCALCGYSAFDMRLLGWGPGSPLCCC